MIEERELATTADLARIELSESDRDRLRSAVSQMVEYFETMAAVDVEGLPPMTHVHADANRVRPDRVQACENTDDLLENAEDLEDRFIAVPNVL